MGSFFSRLLTLSGMLLALTAAAEDGASGPEEKADTNSIVQAALQAEVDGDTSRREVLLTRALERNSKHLPARWHSGHVQSEDRWLTLEEAEDDATKRVRLPLIASSGTSTGAAWQASWHWRGGVGNTASRNERDCIGQARSVLIPAIPKRVAGWESGSFMVDF
jgi:hypothetical protein